MATKTTKRQESLKKQVENLIESAQHTDTRGLSGSEREVYTMQGAGTFTAEYETTPGWTREMMEEELRRRARRIQNRRAPQKTIEDRSTRLQRAMLYIGQHREMIPFLEYMNDAIRQGLRIHDAADVYCMAHGRPEFVQRKWNESFRSYDYTFSPKDIFATDLIGQVPYIPRAWRCA